MISLSLLNKLKKVLVILTILTYSSAFAADPEDIWQSSPDDNEESAEQLDNDEIKIKSPILSEKLSTTTIKIDEEEVINPDQTVTGIFDPQKNNFTLDMWSQTDGNDIKKILKRISKLKLSESSQDLLFQVLFTNSYPPKKNLTTEEFTKIKINWLIKNERLEDLEKFLKNNTEVGKESKAIKYLINEYLSSADIKSACEKIDFISKDINSNYLDKFTIYCMINNERKDEAQLLLDLSKERGLKDKFFESKINYLLGIEDKTSQKILDDNLLNFYLSHMTIDKFEYEPNEKTNKYIWRYLSSANLIEVKDLENEEVLFTYEQAAQDNSFNKDEVFKIYLKMSFNFNQLINAQEIYKTVPKYKSRALIYQSILLSDNIEKKLYLTFLLKDLFIKDKLFNVYSKEMSKILQSIDPNKIPNNYTDLVNENINNSFVSNKKIKFDNDVLHRSKIIKHFLENNEKTNRVKKDFKGIYKKMKKKKYFISIKDIIVLESLVADGFTLPKDLDLKELSNELTVPVPLQDLVDQKQTGLVVLKMVEIIGEDAIRDLNPETIYFLNRILNELNLKKIRNNILSEVLPVKA